jgi:hypothetical protein
MLCHWNRTIRELRDTGPGILGVGGDRSKSAKPNRLPLPSTTKMEFPVAETFKPGDTVPRSGIYRVTHDKQHAAEHEVTVIYGKKFPPCNHCGAHPRFALVRYAQHIEQNDHFKK